MQFLGRLSRIDVFQGKSHVLKASRLLDKDSFAALVRELFPIGIERHDRVVTNYSAYCGPPASTYLARLLPFANASFTVAMR